MGGGSPVLRCAAVADIDEQPSSDAQLPRGSLALLRDRNFGPYLVGRTMATSGMWIKNLASTVLMYQLTGSALMVGLVSVLQFVPTLPLSLVAGAASDQLDRRKLLIAAITVTGAVAAFLAVRLTLHGPEGFGGPAVLLIACFVSGSGSAFSNPALQALVPSLIPRRDWEQGMALAAVVPGLSRTAGPAIGAALLLAGGPALAFAATAVSQVIFAIVLVTLRLEPRVRAASRPSLLGGPRYLRSDPKTALLMIGVAVLAFGADPVITLGPSLAAQMGGGDEVVGLFASAFGVGAFVFAVTFRPLRRFVNLRGVTTIGFVSVVVGGLGVSVSTTTPAAMASFLVMGFGFMMGSTTLNTRIQLRVPDELRGRVMALWNLAFIGSRPVAATVNGLLTDLFSVRVALVVAAVVVLVSVRLARVDDEASR